MPSRVGSSSLPVCSPAYIAPSFNFFWASIICSLFARKSDRAFSVRRSLPGFWRRCMNCRNQDFFLRVGFSGYHFFERRAVSRAAFSQAVFALIHLNGVFCFLIHFAAFGNLKHFLRLHNLFLVSAKNFLFSFSFSVVGSRAGARCVFALVGITSSAHAKICKLIFSLIFSQFVNNHQTMRENKEKSLFLCEIVWRMQQYQLVFWCQDFFES